MSKKSHNLTAQLQSVSKRQYHSQMRTGCIISCYKKSEDLENKAIQTSILSCKSFGFCFFLELLINSMSHIQIQDPNANTQSRTLVSKQFNRNRSSSNEQGKLSTQSWSSKFSVSKRKMSSSLFLPQEEGATKLYKGLAEQQTKTVV